MDLDDLLLNYKEPNFKQIECNIRKKYKEELNDYTFIPKNELYKINTGGILKYVSRKDFTLKTAVLISIGQSNKIVKIIKVKNLAHNNFYNLKASNYFFFYKHKKSIYGGIYALFDQLKND